MSFETLNTELRGLSLSMSVSTGDVLVLSTWWRRLRKREAWVIGLSRHKGLTEFFWVATGARLSNYDLGRCSIVDDPDRWPDEVCAAVAKFKLSQ